MIVLWIAGGLVLLTFITCFPAWLATRHITVEEADFARSLEDQ